MTFPSGLLHKLGQCLSAKDIKYQTERERERETDGGGRDEASGLGCTAHSGFMRPSYPLHLHSHKLFMVWHSGSFHTLTLYLLVFLSLLKH